VKSCDNILKSFQDRELKMEKERVSLRRMTRQIEATVKKLDERAQKSGRSRCDLLDELQRCVDISRTNEAILERIQGHWEERQRRGAATSPIAVRPISGHEPLRRRTWPEEGCE